MTTPLPATCDTLIVGGGVVGLSLAYELSRRDVGVVVVDRQPPGLEASWAGAGILPPGSWYDDHPALASLAALSAPLNARWSAELHELTGIDNEYRVAGAVHLAADDTRFHRLQQKFAAWGELGIETTQLTPDEVSQLEPALRVGDARAVFHTPGEGQINNRRHVEALTQACQQREVAICYPAEVVSLQQSHGRVTAVRTTTGTISADRVVLAAGAWSGNLSELFGVGLPVRPVRGQMLEFGPLAERLLHGNVHCGDQYIVPRSDGRLIVGSTVDEVGFNKQTVAAQLAELEATARWLLPQLDGHQVTNAWAGLRPASRDGLPYLGEVPGLANAWVASGHFRAGLQFAAGTALALADLMTGRAPSIDLQPFRVDR